MARRMHLDIETEAAVDVLMGESFDRQQPGLSDDERCSSSGPLLELHAFLCVLLLVTRGQIP